jgi:Ca-activated chloride channel family protein
VIFLCRDALWLLAIVPGLVFAYLALIRRRKQDALRYSSFAQLREAIGSRLLSSRHVPALLLLLSILALLVASARPAIVSTLSTAEGTVIFAIDVSYSMAARDVEPTRLAAAQAIVKSLAGKLPSTARIGVVAFAQYADLVQPPTLSREAIMAAVDGLRFGYGSGLGTGIAAALMTISPEIDLGFKYDIFGAGRSPIAENGEARPLGARRDGRSRASATVVVLADGASSSGMPALIAAQIAAANEVSLFSIAVGRRSGTEVTLEKWRFHAEFLPAILEKIARKTHGAYFHIDDTVALKTLQPRLAATLGTRSAEEITAVFAAMAAVLLVVGGLSSAVHSRV